MSRKEKGGSGDARHPSEHKIDASVTRRTVLAGTAAAGVGAAAAPAAAQDTSTPGDEGDDLEIKFPGRAKGSGRLHLTHGPILGRLTETSVGVWARTNKPAAKADGFRVYYGTDPAKLDQFTDRTPTDLADDNSAVITVSGLKSDTCYYYAVGFDDIVHQPEHRGSFRTLPAPRQYRNADHNPRGLYNFSFAVGGCARMVPYSSSGLEPQRVMMNNHGKKVHFAIQTGDFVYEEGRHTLTEEWLWRMGLDEDAVDLPRAVNVAPSLVGAWENYKTYFTKNYNLAEWHRHVPSYYMFDDHEVINNIYGASVPGFVSRNAVYRDIGLKAWNDYLAWSNPVEDRLQPVFGRAELKAGDTTLYDPDADFRKLDLDRQSILHVHWSQPTDGVPSRKYFRDGPGDPNTGVYGIEEIIDRRRLRLSHPAKVDTDASSYSIGPEQWAKFRTGNIEFYLIDTRGERGLPNPTFQREPVNTMLGARQKKWLKENMAASDADAFVVVSSVNLMLSHAGGDVERGGRSEEAWAGFMAEREELIEFWDGLGKPVMMFNADLHNAFSVQVTDNVWEFTASPTNSDNQHKLPQEGNRPKNGVYDSGGRKATIRWSTFSLPETPRENLRQPVYAVVSVNNVFNNPRKGSEDYWAAYDHPQIVVQFYCGKTGNLLYAESIVAGLPK